MAAAFDWKQLIDDAQKISHPKGPEKLTALFDSKNFFSNTDEQQFQSISEANQSDLGRIHDYRYSGQPLSDDDRPLWLDRLAWLLCELEACTQQKPGFVKLRVLLMVSEAFSLDTNIWEHIPATILSDNLFAALAAFVGCTSYEISSREQNEPIWEREAVDDFLQADKDSDWPRIEALWRTVASAIAPDYDLAEATKCLCSAEKGKHALALAMDKFNSVLPILSVASTMSSSQIGAVAPLLKSNRARFVLVQSLAFNHPRNESLSQETLEGLASVFRQVQQDVGEWQKWMSALNRYPVRTNVFQSAFGESLVDSTLEAKSAYVLAICLSTSRTEGRLAVTNCFASFAQRADLEERKEFWEIVQRRWVEWNFKERTPENHLTDIAVSELDYGVIGYAVENLTASERYAALEKIIEEINGVASIWHQDLVSYYSTWYRAISKWQVVQYAQQIIEGNAIWELPRHIYLPRDPATDRYFAMTYPRNRSYVGWN